jgi:KDO2-lipid IV(A) lauroyltransferase
MTRHLVDWLQYAALRFCGGLIPCIDSSVNLDTASGVGTLYWRLSGRHRRRAILNISAAMPELSANQVEALAEASVRSLLSMFLVDALVMPRRITRSGWTEWVRLGPMSGAVELLLEDRPALLITAHQGNFELLGYTLSMLEIPISALARPLDNPMLDDWLLGQRRRHGLEIITKWGASPAVLDAIERRRKVAFIADQDAGADGVFVPFFDRLASAYKSIALVAVRYRLPLVAGYAKRIGPDFQYELVCIDRLDPHQWEDHPDPTFLITAWYTWAIERMVRDAPEQYWWLHRRWKSRPRFEQRGESMPPRLRAKLESLPWMTPQRLDRIRQHSEDGAGVPSPGTAR